MEHWNTGTIKLTPQPMSSSPSLKQLKKRLAELERLLEQKQIEMEFYKKMIDLAEEHYGMEIKEMKKGSSNQQDNGNKK
ncbi:MAG: hypothetical protein GX419_04600 [Bacteroidales bacterium]|nr:hypothetical protein [Bacteroidales bacterium]